MRENQYGISKDPLLSKIVRTKIESKSEPGQYSCNKKAAGKYLQFSQQTKL
jgi:hypothetical protein